MYKADVAFDTTLLDTIRAVAEHQPEIVARYVRRELRPFVSQLVDQRLRVEPPPAKRPIEWTSERQRKAYFATDGFGHGIPYKRSGRLVKAWSVRGDYTDTFSGVSIMNTAPIARYVYGRDQQRFHANTGWSFAPSVLQTISLQANDFALAGIAHINAQAMKGHSWQFTR